MLKPRFIDSEEYVEYRGAEASRSNSVSSTWVLGRVLVESDELADMADMLRETASPPGLETMKV